MDVALTIVGCVVSALLTLAMQEITMPLSDYDIDLLIRHLRKQAAIVRVYL